MESGIKYHNSYPVLIISFQLYNRALIIYDDARVKDSLEFLEDNIRRINENIIPDETDDKMMSLYSSKNVYTMLITIFYRPWNLV